MEYYRLLPDRRISNAIHIKNPNPKEYHKEINREGYEKVSNMRVAYFDNSPEKETPDYLEEPMLLISDEVKRLWLLYEPKMQMKGLQCYPEDIEDMQSLLYWWPYITRVACLAEETEKYPTGLLKHLVIAEEKIRERHIFQVDGVLEQVILVSRTVVESMLRRGMWGMEFSPVDIRRR